MFRPLRPDLREAELTARLEALSRSLEEQRTLLERGFAIHRDLTQVVLEDQGMAAIAAALARLLSSY